TARMIAVMRNPRGRWRWPKSRPRGPTGRVGAGLKGPDLPRDEARFSSRRLGRNPPSGTPVTRQDAAPLPDGCSPLPKWEQRRGPAVGGARRVGSAGGHAPRRGAAGWGPRPARPAAEPDGRTEDERKTTAQIRAEGARRRLDWGASDKGASDEGRRCLKSA